MPEMDGLEALRRIRALEGERGGHTPVVAVTARAMVGDRESILAAGMDDYLEKPIHVERLERVLSRMSALRPPFREPPAAAGVRRGSGDGSGPGFQTHDPPRG